MVHGIYLTLNIIAQTNLNNRNKIGRMSQDSASKAVKSIKKELFLDKSATSAVLVTETAKRVLQINLEIWEVFRFADILHNERRSKTVKVDTKISGCSCLVLSVLTAATCIDEVLHLRKWNTAS